MAPAFCPQHYNMYKGDSRAVLVNLAINVTVFFFDASEYDLPVDFMLVGFFGSTFFGTVEVTM